MCGLAGILQSRARMPEAELSALAGTMGDALRHRGPDDRGVWSDAAAGIALAHRRLSILDRSSRGHQPMASKDGRYRLAYNGEIYNFGVLRNALEALGHGFEGHSDTEVLLAAVTQWGLEATLTRCNGMFAIALWDRREQRLSLARDRVGKKPLYYGWAGNALVFASELKALWRHPAFDNGIDRDALTLLLRLDYIPAPHCIHECAFKLMAGRVLHFSAERVAAGAAAHCPEQAQVPFWDARERMRCSLAHPFTGNEALAADALDQHLRQAVALRMVADVPVGVFLSGGTDSATVAAMMQAQSSTPIHSFSIGFEDSEHDEAPLAREVARHLQCDHTELYVSGADAAAVVPQLPTMFDEPFADASQVPSALVARLARRGVTVALSGDGGDELFMGYTRYRRALRNWRALQRIPDPLRRWLDRHAGVRNEDARAGGLAALRAELGAQGIGDVYRNRISRWRNPAAVVGQSTEPATFYRLADPLRGHGGPGDAMMLADFTTYLADDLLCKIDRTSMATGLEARAPLLDCNVVEFAWSLPADLKLREGTSKYLLKQVLRRYLPDPMVFRGKRGFGAPVTQWLRGDLSAWAGDLLAPSRLRQDGILDEAAVTALWRRFRKGERKWHTHLWNVLMFQAWQTHWRAARSKGA